MNHDGLVDGAAVPDWRDLCSGDVESNPDAQLDFDDLAAFVECLLTP